MKAVFGVALLFLLGPVVGVAVLLGAGTGPEEASVALCRTTGPIEGLSPVQARNARAIVAAAQQTVIEAGQGLDTQQQAELIALITAQTESSLHDYANPTVPGSEQLPNDGQPPTGGDHDSVGLFQQRASWGPLAARMDPGLSTKLFVERLLKLPAWQTTAPAVAAQAVQISAAPDRYAAAVGPATAWLKQILTSPEVARCGADGLPPAAAGPVPAGAIPPGYAIPAVATDAERRAVTFALAQLGKPYVFGAPGPDAYDCSGLTMAAWAAAGVRLPHYTVAQYAMGTPVAAPSLLSPGDLILIPGSDGSIDPPNPQHVGMYIGAGYVIEAPQTGDVVKIVPLASFRPIVGMRHIA